VPIFRLARRIGRPQGGPEQVPVLAVAGIASPQRFFEDLRDARWTIARTMVFPDHHPYSSADVRRIVRAAREAGAVAVLTTEKDYVRLRPYRPFPMPVSWVPLTMEPDPLPEFRHWLAGSLRAARDIVG
jgi:tetraacyldisaccharide 4'-kinase